MMLSDAYTWAVYDEYDTKLVGGFKSRKQATDWRDQHLPYIIMDQTGNEITRVPTAYEADLTRVAFPALVAEQADPRTYHVYVESD